MNFAFLLALLFSAVCIGLCWLAWQKKLSSKKSLNALLLLASFIGTAMYWFVLAGYEYGSAFFLLSVSPIAWLLIALLNRPDSGTKKKPEKSSQALSVKFSALGRFSLLAISATIIGLSCATVCAALAPWLPVNLATQWVLAALLFPCLWAVLMYWYAADRLFWRPIAASSATALLCFTLIKTGVL